MHWDTSFFDITNINPSTKLFPCAPFWEHPLKAQSKPDSERFSFRFDISVALIFRLVSSWATLQCRAGRHCGVVMGDIALELCTGQKNEPQMGKRENEGKKEKKQKKERKIKRKQYRGLYLNPISVPHARTRACEERRLACTCTFSEAGEAAMEIIDN